MRIIPNIKWAAGPGYGDRTVLVNLVVLAGLVLFGSVHAHPARAQAAAAATGAPVKILVLGDSLSAGYNLPADQSFPSQLEKALRAKGLHVDVINAGVSGDTSAGGKARLEWALKDKPNVAILELGANDGLRGLDPAQTFANLDAIVARMKNDQIRVLIAGMLAPPNLGRSYGQEFGSVFPRLAEKHGVPLYPFFLDGVAADPALNLADGIHPNAKGVAVIVEKVLPYLQPLLKDTGR
jgi:acyl-CoA thioesterase-1